MSDGIIFSGSGAGGGLRLSGPFPVFRDALALRSSLLAAEAPCIATSTSNPSNRIGRQPRFYTGGPAASDEENRSLAAAPLRSLTDAERLFGGPVAIPIAVSILEQSEEPHAMADDSSAADSRRQVHSLRSQFGGRPNERGLDPTQGRDKRATVTAILGGPHALECSGASAAGGCGGRGQQQQRRRAAGGGLVAIREYSRTPDREQRPPHPTPMRPRHRTGSSSPACCLLP